MWYGNPVLAIERQLASGCILFTADIPHGSYVVIAKAVPVVELSRIVEPAVGGAVVHRTCTGHPGDVVLVVKLIVPVNGDIGENLTCFRIDPLVGVVFQSLVSSIPRLVSWKLLSKASLP